MKTFIFVTLLLGSSAFGGDKYLDVDKVKSVCKLEDPQSGLISCTDGRYEYINNVERVCRKNKEPSEFMACMYRITATIHSRSASLLIENSNICAVKNIKSKNLCRTDLEHSSFIYLISEQIKNSDRAARIARACHEDAGKWFSTKCSAIIEFYRPYFGPLYDLKNAVTSYVESKSRNNTLKESKANAVYRE